MTQPKYTNADCPLYGSEYCAALNMESCEKCTVDCTDEEKTARVKQDLADMAALLPEDGMAKLFTGEECAVQRRKEQKGILCLFRYGASRRAQAQGEGAAGPAEKRAALRLIASGAG